MNTHSNSVGGIQRLNRRTFIKTSAMLATSSSALLAACGGSPASPTTSSTPTELLYTYTTFSGAPADLAAVQSAINATPAMKAKNLRIKLEPIDFAAYEQKLKLRFAAGTPGDAVFTASWVNNFYSNVAQGNFTVLDELLARYAPRLAASMPATGLRYRTGRWQALWYSESTTLPEILGGTDSQRPGEEVLY